MCLRVLSLDDTSRCPKGHRCESCGIEGGDDLAVTTVGMGSLGVACLTMCTRCAESTVTPPVTVGTAARLTLQHRLHLGITVDDGRKP